MTDDRYSVVIPDTDYFRKMVKCQAACPVLTDARAYVTAIARGDLADGYRIAHDPNPLSTICGRICGAPCETACRRGDIGPDWQPIAIRPLKRVLTERFGPEASQLPGQAVAAASDQSVAADGTLPGLGTNALYSPARWSMNNCVPWARSPVASVAASPLSAQVRPG